MDNIFRKDEYGYEGYIELKDWSDFFDCKCELRVELGGDSTVDSIQKIHLDTLNEIIINQKEILLNLLNFLFKRYPEIREEYQEFYDEDEIEDYLPEIEDIEDFWDIIKPNGIHIMNIALDGKYCIGYDFSCSWEEDHGIGFMTYDKEVYSFGGADEAFLSWVAKDVITTISS